MQFQPRTVEEITKEKREFAAQSLLPKGWYDFEVMDAQEAVSKRSGKDMIKLKLRVFNPNGGEKHVYDYLIETAPTHLFDFCESVGLENEYHQGTLTAADCKGRAGKVQIAIDDKDKNYDPKNVAKNYASPQALIKTPAASAAEPDDDEIPF
jgi:hypothetical protein